MEIFEMMAKYEHEQVVFCYDKVSGLKAIIVIHDTTLVPALAAQECGPRAEEEALFDVKALQGMTFEALHRLASRRRRAVITATRVRTRAGNNCSFGRFAVAGRQVYHR